MTFSSSIPLDPNPKSDLDLNQESVRQLAAAAGFVEAGIVSVPHHGAQRDAVRFKEFVDRGYAGGMDYLARSDERGRLLRGDVTIPFPWARSVVVCLASYHADKPLSTAPAEGHAGWIARYAWTGKSDADGATRPADYHKILLKRLKALETEMRCEWGNFDCQAYVDTGPVAERSIARAAGVGWTGKNTCLIHPKLGSWNFLAVLVTSLEFAEEAAPLVVPDRCGSCRRCLDACPTDALIEPYRMDATRCISYLTIEHRGEIGEELMDGMGRQVFGCDICQDVCPWNRKAPIQPASGREDDFVVREELVNPALEWLADLDRAGFERLFNGSPVRRTGFEGLKRNVAIAMGNSGLRRFVPRLERWAAGQFEDEPTVNPQTMREAASDKAMRNRSALTSAARWALEKLAN